MVFLNFIPAALLLLFGVFLPLGSLVHIVVQSGAASLEQIATPWILRVSWFTLWQAFFSAFVSVAFGFLFSTVAANRKFPLRRELLALSALPFALPSVLVAFAFVVTYGGSGFVSNMLGMGSGFLYTPVAVIAAHAFFNMPFAFRQCVEALESLPREQVRAARILNFGKLRTFRHVVFPQIAPVLTSLFLMIFILCLSSFAVVLLLGGGPQATTIEVAVYQSLRFDAEPANASLLALFQMLLVLPFVFLYRKFNFQRYAGRATVSQETFADRAPKRFYWKAFVGTWIFLLPYIFFLVLPLLGLIVDARKGFSQGMPFLLNSNFVAAIFGSLQLALPAALLCVFTTWGFARGVAAMQNRHPLLSAFLADSTWMLMALSPTILTLAWIVMLSYTPWDVYGNPFPTLIAVHSLLAFPICARVLLPAALLHHFKHTRSAESIGILGWKKMKLVEFPDMRRSLLAAFFLAFAFSFGDVSSVLMFGAGTISTLPMFIFELMGAYRFGAAAISSVLLAIVCSGFFWISDSYFSQDRKGN